MKHSDTIRPKQLRILQVLGENIKLARLRRSLTAEQVAERAGLSRRTLYSLEAGNPSVSLGRLLKVLAVLGLEQDLGTVAEVDEVGRRLQDLGLASSKRSTSRRKRMTDHERP